MYLAATVFPAPLSPLFPRQEREKKKMETVREATRSALRDNSNSPDDDALILPFDHHVPVHVVRQGVDVRRILILGLREGERRPHWAQGRCDVGQNSRAKEQLIVFGEFYSRLLGRVRSLFRWSRASAWTGSPILKRGRCTSEWWCQGTSAGNQRRQKYLHSVLRWKYWYLCT